VANVTRQTGDGDNVRQLARDTRVTEIRSCTAEFEVKKGAVMVTWLPRTTGAPNSRSGLLVTVALEKRGTPGGSVSVTTVLEAVAALLVSVTYHYLVFNKLLPTVTVDGVPCTEIVNPSAAAAQWRRTNGRAQDGARPRGLVVALVYGVTLVKAPAALGIR